MSLETVLADLRVEVSSLDGALLSGSAAKRKFEVFAGIKRLAESGQLLVAARVNESNAWHGEGHQSCADWMASENGEAVGRAAQTLSAGKRLEELPSTADAVRGGELSVDQAAAVTEGAAADPAAEGDLLGSAKKKEPLRQLRKKSKRVKAAALSPKQQRERVWRTRDVKQWVEEDGTAKTLISGPRADQVELAAALRLYHERRFREARGTGAEDSYGNRQYDAFMDVVRRSVSEGTDGNGDRLPGGHNVKIIGLVDASAFERGETVAGETCEVAGIGPVPVSVIEELLATGNPFVAAVIKRGVDVVNVSHMGRGLNVFQRTAMEAQHIECSNIVCNRTVNIEMDHGVPYATDQVTELRNQRPLCSHDHKLKTHHGWDLVAGTGRRAFVPPGHPDHPSKPGAPNGEETRRPPEGSAGPEPGEPGSADPSVSGGSDASEARTRRAQDLRSRAAAARKRREPERDRPRPDAASSRLPGQLF